MTIIVYFNRHRELYLEKVKSFQFGLGVFSIEDKDGNLIIIPYNNVTKVKRENA